MIRGQLKIRTRTTSCLAVYSAIGRDRLVSLAKGKEIFGFQDSELKTQPWIFDRESIDEYRKKQGNLIQSETAQLKKRLGL